MWIIFSLYTILVDALPRTFIQLQIQSNRTTVKKAFVSQLVGGSTGPGYSRLFV